MPNRPVRGTTWSILATKRSRRVCSRLPAYPRSGKLIWLMGGSDQVVRRISAHLKICSQTPKGSLHADCMELETAVPADVSAPWKKVNNIQELTDFAGYETEFLRLLGFEVEGVC